MAQHTFRFGMALLGAAAAALAPAGCEPPPPPAVSTAPTAPVAPPAAGSVAQQLAALPIAPEDTGAHYDRAEWPHWTETGQGCDMRDEVLRSSGQGVTVGADCALSGQWTSVYDGKVVTDPGDLDIDHIVPLAEVARSGPVVNGRRVRPGEWTEDQRRAYANDPEVLVAVTANSNRSKGDDDPARWMPSNDPCGYLTRWVAVKTKYGLSVDQTEHDAIAGALTTCPA